MTRARRPEARITASPGTLRFCSIYCARVSQTTQIDVVCTCAKRRLHNLPLRRARVVARHISSQSLKMRALARTRVTQVARLSSRKYLAKQHRSARGQTHLRQSTQRATKLARTLFCAQAQSLEARALLLERVAARSDALAGCNRLPQRLRSRPRRRDLPATSGALTRPSES